MALCQAALDHQLACKERWLEAAGMHQTAEQQRARSIELEKQADEALQHAREVRPSVAAAQATAEQAQSAVQVSGVLGWG